MSVERLMVICHFSDIMISSRQSFCCFWAAFCRVLCVVMVKDVILSVQTSSQILKLSFTLTVIFFVNYCRVWRTFHFLWLSALEQGYFRCKRNAQISLIFKTFRFNSDWNHPDNFSTSAAAKLASKWQQNLFAWINITWNDMWLQSRHLARRMTTQYKLTIYLVFAHHRPVGLNQVVHVIPFVSTRCSGQCFDLTYHRRHF